MRVEQNRALSARDGKCGKDERVSVRLEHLDVEAAPLKQRAQQIGVASDVWAIGRDVGNREQLDELAEDLRLMCRDVRLNRPLHLR